MRKKERRGRTNLNLCWLFFETAFRFLALLSISVFPFCFAFSFLARVPFFFQTMTMLCIFQLKLLTATHSNMTCRLFVIFPEHHVGKLQVDLGKAKEV